MMARYCRQIKVDSTAKIKNSKSPPPVRKMSTASRLILRDDGFLKSTVYSYYNRAFKERGKGKGMQIAAHAHETIPRQLSEIICYKTEIDC